MMFHFHKRTRNTHIFNEKLVVNGIRYNNVLEKMIFSFYSLFRATQNYYQKINIIFFVNY